MYIPKFFKLKEFTKSATAKKIGSQNVPTFEAVKNISRLCQYILDPVRFEYGAPIIISSGYRNKDVNTAVGGVKNSQHTKGLASDLQCNDLPRLFNILKKNKYIDQLIIESNNGVKWLHVSIAEEGKEPRNMIFTQQK